MPTTPPLRLRRLKVHRFGVIMPGTELRFSDGTNVLLGRNGTGKTTLLDLIARAVRGTFSGLEQEEFDVEFDIGYQGLAGLISTRVTNRQRATTGRKRARPTFQWTLSITIVTDEGRPQTAVTLSLQAGDEQLRLVDAGGEKRVPYFGTLNPFTDDSQGLRSTLQLVLEDFANSDVASWLLPTNATTNATRLDEAREWLTTTLEDPNAGLSLEKPGPDSWSRGMPWDLVDALSAVLQRDLESLTISCSSADGVPSLQRIVNALGYASGQVILEQESATAERVSFGDITFHFKKHDGTTVRLEQLSFGEQRLFAFYYYLACTSQVVIADELTNGMHYDMVSGCMEAMHDRQAFLATQNPLLLDHLNFDSLDEVRAAFVLCAKKTSDGREWMSMRALNDEEARDFFGHYQVEIKQVNAILRWLGLW